MLQIESESGVRSYALSYLIVEDSGVFKTDLHLFIAIIFIIIKYIFIFCLSLCSGGNCSYLQSVEGGKKIGVPSKVVSMSVGKATSLNYHSFRFQQHAMEVLLEIGAIMISKDRRKLNIFQSI